MSKKKISKKFKTDIDDFMPTVPLKRYRDLYFKTKEWDEETPLSLQIVLSFLFPTVWKNIESYTKDCYTKGYIQGREDEKNEAKRNNR